MVTFRAAAFGRSTSYTLRYDFSEAPHILSWKLTKGDITSKLDGSYVFDPAEGSGTQVRYHLEAELRATPTRRTTYAFGLRSPSSSTPITAASATA